ncbi:MAG: type III pantothenate kinase [Rhodanobacter sp.]
MRLLLDLGNTRLKWALAEPASQAWVAQGAVDWQDDVAAALASAWAGMALPVEVVAASVVASARETELAAIVFRLLGAAPLWMRTPASACGVINAYPEPQRLGVDRFLALLAAYADQRAPCVVVNVGTALTLDALTADGLHLGGLIAPSPALMQQALSTAAARVPLTREGTVVELADNTADAVASGCWQAAVALVERFAMRMTDRLGGAPSLILGGGDAERLASLLSVPAHVSSDAVLRGLALWATTQLPPPQLT